MDEDHLQVILNDLQAWINDKNKNYALNIVRRVVSAKTGQDVNESFSLLA